MQLLYYFCYDDTFEIKGVHFGLLFFIRTVETIGVEHRGYGLVFVIDKKYCRYYN